MCMDTVVCGCVSVWMCRCVDVKVCGCVGAVHPSSLKYAL